jgi:hypothetical protein
MTDSSSNKILPHLDEMYIEFEKKTKMKKKEYMRDVLELTKQNFIKHNIILYGGTAMNMYLDDKSKFYTVFDIPDYDGYILNAQKTSLNFAKQLKQKNYNYILLKKAFHKNTFKLSWEFNDIADFTDISEDDYKLLVKKSTRIDGFLVAPLSLIKSNAYLELCLPLSSMFRWNKIYTRILILEKNTKELSVSKTKLKYEASTLSDAIVTQIVKLIIDNNIPFVGMKAMRYFLGHDIWKHETIGNFAYVSCMTLSDSVFNQKIEELLSIQNISFESKTTPASSFILEKTTYFVTMQRKRIKLLSVHKTKAQCFSYIQVKQKKTEFSVISVFYLISILYFYQFVFASKSNTKLDEQNVIMIRRLSKLITSKKMFSETCLGSNVSKESILKNRLKMGENPILFSHTQ